MSDQDRLLFKMLVTCEGQHRGHAAEEQDLGHGVLWVHPCWRLKRAQLPAAPKEARKLLVYCTIQLPARMPSNSNMSVPRGAKETHFPQPCVFVHTLCTVLALEETKTKSQPDLETEKDHNR